MTAIDTASPATMWLTVAVLLAISLLGTIVAHWMGSRPPRAPEPGEQACRICKHPFIPEPGVFHVACPRCTGRGRAMSLKVGELFAGYSGLGMGLAQVIDTELAWVSEIADARRLLAMLGLDAPAPESTPTPDRDGLRRTKPIVRRAIPGTRIA